MTFEPTGPPERRTSSPVPWALAAAAVTFLIGRLLAPIIFEFEFSGPIDRLSPSDGLATDLEAAFGSAIAQILGLSVACGLIVFLLGTSRSGSGSTTRFSASGSISSKRIVSTNLRGSESPIDLDDLDPGIRRAIEGFIEFSPTRSMSVSVDGLRLGRMVDDIGLLEGVGPSLFSSEILDLSSLAEDVADRFESRFASESIRLVVDAGHQIRVRASAAGVERAVSNVLENALEHTEAGGSVHLTCRREDGNGVITVEDDGEGIAPEQLERIFDRFHGDERRGTAGLGLTVARSIAESFGGGVTAGSRGTGLGATFRMSFPLVD